MEKQNRDNAEISEIERLVYDILLDTVQEEYRIPWVTPIFVPGHLCFDAYCDMQAAYERLRQRLGAADEDPDVEMIIDCLLKHGKILALEMFRCGRIYQQTQAETTVGAGH